MSVNPTVVLGHGAFSDAMRWSPMAMALPGPATSV